MRNKWILLVCVTLISATNARAGDKHPCTVGSRPGTECTVQLHQVHPTQFAVGMREVLQKRDDIAEMGSSKLKKYLHEHFLPCVIGPDGRFYTTNSHHHALAAMLDQIKTYPAKIVENWHDLDWQSFWDRMEQKKWLYLYDENGMGPRNPDDLPRSLNKLKDDPYRSLAWAVRKKGGYEDTNQNYADFAWANFFRSRIDVYLLQNDFHSAVQQGVELAESPDARGLPGYDGDRAKRHILSLENF